MTLRVKCVLALLISLAVLGYWPVALGPGASYVLVDDDLRLVVHDWFAAVRFDLSVRLLGAMPDPDTDPLLVQLHVNTPRLFRVFGIFSLFAPGVLFVIVVSFVQSVASVWLQDLFTGRRKGDLPPWPLKPGDPAPALCIGEVHYKQRVGEAKRPRWLVMPEKGLYTGLAIFGAIGTGKTTSCMKPFTRQLLQWRHDDPELRVAMLVLEVKGDFCYHVKGLLEDVDRLDDYMELTLSPDGYQWNPLHAPWLDTYSLAYTLASLVNQLFGKSKEPFWQQAYTNVVRWLVETYRSFPDPWFTFKDIYTCMLDREALEALIDKQTAYVFGKYQYELHMEDEVYQANRERLDTITLTEDDLKASIETEGTPVKGGGLRRALTERCLGPKKAPRVYQFDWQMVDGHRVVTLNDTEYLTLIWEVRKEGRELRFGAAQLAAPTADELSLNQEIDRWYKTDWLGLDEKLRSSIVEGMSVFLGIFAVPRIARIFCPKNPAHMTEEEKERLMPPLDRMIEDGKILALNMPAGESAALSRAAGVMLKQSWLSTLLLRPKAMALAPKDKKFRPAVFVCDEYQTFVTCGEDDPSGDEKAFALTRQSKCIPIVATQSIASLKSVLGEGEAWRALLQTLRSRIFLSLADDFSQKTASDLLGQVNRMTASYSISENTGKASASLMTGRMGGGTASAGLSKSYQQRREALFHQRDLSLLPTCQAIAQIFDGAVVRDATRVYLKPDYRPRDEPYWRWYERELAPRESADVV